MAEDKKVTEISRPKKQTTALVFDSPHSGRIYPADFDFHCDINDLRTAEDMYVDELFDHVPQSGAPFLKALFPRAYIDPNRGLPANDNTAPKNANRGLCRTVCNGVNRIPIYDEDKQPTAEQKQARIDQYYKEYHENLRDIIDTTYQEFNHVLHINCHSMPSKRGNGDDNIYDIILGNREGRTCADEIIETIKTALEDMGYKVGVNIKGYRGAEIVRRYGQPEDDKHSVQFEINRKLYMNEKTFKKTSNFNNLKRDLKALCDELSQQNPARPKAQQRNKKPARFTPRP